MEEKPEKIPSSQEPPQEQSQSEIKKEKSPIPQIENYIHPVNIETLKSIEDIIEFTLKNYTKKLEQSKAFKMEYDMFKKECEKDIKNIENVRDISNKKVVFCIDMKLPSIVAYQEYNLFEYKDDIIENNEEKEEDEGEGDEK